jgi:hypothetical protein
MGATVPGSATGTSVAAVSVTVGLAGSVSNGDRQYAIVESSTADAHVWPGTWTVLLASAGEAGYVSVATRVRQAGDTNPSVSNGGHAANWAYTQVYVESTGGHTPTVVGSATQVDASGTNMTVPAVAEAQAQYTLLWLASATVGDVSAFYPFTNELGASGTPIVLWWPHVTPGSPGFTLVRGTARPTVSYLAVLSESISYQAAQVIVDAEWALGRGYNYNALEQPAWGGSIQIV